MTFGDLIDRERREEARETAKETTIEYILDLLEDLGDIPTGLLERLESIEYYEMNNGTKPKKKVWIENETKDFKQKSWIQGTQKR